MVCENCSEYTLSEKVTVKIMQIADESVAKRVEIEGDCSEKCVKNS